MKTPRRCRPRGPLPTKWQTNILQRFLSAEELHALYARYRQYRASWCRADKILCSAAHQVKLRHVLTGKCTFHKGMRDVGIKTPGTFMKLLDAYRATTRGTS